MAARRAGSATSLLADGEVTELELDRGGTTGVVRVPGARLGRRALAGVGRLTATLAYR